MPRPHIHGSPRRFHYGSNLTDDSGNDNFRSPIRMHNANITSTYDYGCNTEIYGLIRIATADAGSYPWLILFQIRECVTWALANSANPMKCRILSGSPLFWSSKNRHHRIGCRLSKLKFYFCTPFNFVCLIDALRPSQQCFQSF